jgi:hypothetical protein
MLASSILYVLAKTRVGCQYYQTIIDLGPSGYMSSLAMPNINAMAKPLTTCMELFFLSNWPDRYILEWPRHYKQGLGAHTTIYPRQLHSNTLSQIIRWSLGHCVIRVQSMSVLGSQSAELVAPVPAVRAQPQAASLVKSRQYCSTSANRPTSISNCIKEIRKEHTRLRPHTVLKVVEALSEEVRIMTH